MGNPLWFSCQCGAVLCELSMNKCMSEESVDVQLLWVEAADLEESPPPEKAAAAQVPCASES